MSNINLLPFHPPPKYEKSIGEWIETLAEVNKTPFKVMFLYITKKARDIEFFTSLRKLTGISKEKIIQPENQFKPRYWEIKRVCIVKGCKFKRNNISHLFEHLENIHHLGDGWYWCKICDYKTKLIEDIEDHLIQNHAITEIKKFYKIP